MGAPLQVRIYTLMENLNIEDLPDSLRAADTPSSPAEACIGLSHAGGPSACSYGDDNVASDAYERQSHYPDGTFNTSATMVAPVA